jgi:hypothetical protein
MGRGRGTAPFPGTPSPKTKLGRLHKNLDTPTSAGGTLSSLFTLDPDGKTRGADGTWDRGAYEF